MVHFLIKGATLITVNKNREVLEDSALVIKDDRIVDIGPSKLMEQKYSDAAEIIDASGKAVFPGLINTHNHLFQTLLKGLGDDKVLSEWLATMTAPSAVHLMPWHAAAAADLGCLEGIKSGTTTMLDYMYPHARPGLSEPIINSFQQLGMRGIFGRGMMTAGKQFGVPTGVMQDLTTIERDIVDLMDKYHNGTRNCIKVWLAPAAVWSNTVAVLKRVRELATAYKTGITVHISETPFDRQASQELHGYSDIELLEKIGFLGPDVLMVHCVHLTQRDIRLTKALELKVSHNPVSNMYLASGTPPIPDMLERGITVGLATDGAASNNTNDMMEVLKFGALMHKVHTMDPTVITAEKVLEMATIDGAKTLGMNADIGSLEVGKKADLFIFNPLRDAKAIPMHNPVSTLVYSSSSNNIEMVMIDGKVVLKNGNLTTADENRIKSNALKAAEDLAASAGTDKFKFRPWRSLAY